MYLSLRDKDGVSAKGIPLGGLDMIKYLTDSLSDFVGGKPKLGLNDPKVHQLSYTA